MAGRSPLRGSGHQPTASATSCTASSQSGVPNAVADGLANARALIERGWMQGWFARTATKRDCWSRDPDAVCWCASGAITRAFGSYDSYDNRAEAQAAREFLERAIGDEIPRWNDARDRKKSEVIEAFKRAEQLAREEA